MKTQYLEYQKTIVLLLIIQNQEMSPQKVLIQNLFQMHHTNLHYYKKNKNKIINYLQYKRSNYKNILNYNNKIRKI